jgi:hypothetical protein
VLDWVTDKALASLPHDQAFVVAADVEQPVYLVQGVYSNALGHPTVVEWIAVQGLPDAPTVTTMDQAFLTACGVSPTMPGRALPVDIDGLQRHVAQAIDVATAHLSDRRDRYDAQVDDLLAPTCVASTDGPSNCGCSAHRRRRSRGSGSAGKISWARCARPVPR